MESFLRKIKRAIFVLIVPCIFMGSYGMTNLYKAYVNNQFIGYVQSKDEVREMYKEIVDDVSNKFSSIDIGRNQLSFEGTNKSENPTSKDEVKSNLIKNADIEIDAYGMCIDNINVGYVENFKTGEEVIESLKNEAKKESSVDNQTLLSVEVKGDLTYTEERVKISEICSAKEVVDNIEKLNKDREDKIASVEILELKKEIEEVEQSTKVMTSNNLYLGQEMELDGEQGKKEVKKKNVYVDGKIVKTTVLEENMIYEPKDNIVYKGVQNPVSSGFVFLTYPSESRTITSSFGKRWGNENHKGIDIAGTTGQNINAAFEGTVKFAGWMGGYGNVVIIDHGSDIQTLYAHASKLTAKTGDKVNKGDKIAEVGSTGRSTGPHIHFELRNNGKQVNPIGYMK